MTSPFQGSIVNADVVLATGSRGPETGSLQRFLVSLGYVDPNGAPLAIDEDFGPKTTFALATFQRNQGMTATGRFDQTTRRIAMMLGFVPFLQARHFRSRWPNPRVVSLIVVHTMECSEDNLAAAEDVATWFASDASPVASAHFCVDQDSVVQCVREEDIAFHVQSDASDTGNARSIGVEHAGFARQLASGEGDTWADAASQNILFRSAKLAARLARVYQIPFVKLSPEQVRAGTDGFCGHVDVTRAYAVPGGHTDPGDGFPWADYLALVQEST